jgi:branched-chain amino acid aminotransferase
VDRNGLVLEGTTSNLFAFFSGTLVTPNSEILRGVTRKAVLDLAAKIGPVDLRDLSLAELLTADEVFISGTNKMIVPVVQVDDRVIGEGRPGRHTRHLMNALRIRIDEHYKKQKV